MAYRTAVASDLTGYGHGEGVLQTTNRRARHSGRRKPQWHENPSTFGRAGSIPASGTNHLAAARHPWPLPLHRIGVMPLRGMPSWWAYSPSHTKLASVAAVSYLSLRPLWGRSATRRYSTSFSTAHTVSSMRGWAFACGWMRSAWNQSGSSAKPSSRKGTSGLSVSAATLPNIWLNWRV